MTEQTNVSPNAGAHGTSLTVRTSASYNMLTPNKSGFYFHYAYPGDPTPCHSETNIGLAVSSTSSGDIAPVARTIPRLGATGGTGEACWAVPNTTHNSQMALDAVITVN